MSGRNLFYKLPYRIYVLGATAEHQVNSALTGSETTHLSAVSSLWPEGSARGRVGICAQKTASVGPARGSPVESCSVHVVPCHVPFLSALVPSLVLGNCCAGPQGGQGATKRIWHW